MHIVSPCLLCGSISCELCSCAHTWINVLFAKAGTLRAERQEEKQKKGSQLFCNILFSPSLRIFFVISSLSLSLSEQIVMTISFITLLYVHKDRWLKHFFLFNVLSLSFYLPPYISFLSLLNEFCSFDVWRALFGIFYTTYLSTLTSSIAAFDIHCLEFILMSTGYLAMFPTRFTTKD